MPSNSDEGQTCNNCKYRDAVPPGELRSDTKPCGECIELRYSAGPGRVTFPMWEARDADQEDRKTLAERLDEIRGKSARVVLIDNELQPSPVIQVDSEKEFAVVPPAPGSLQGVGMKHDLGKNRIGILLREFPNAIVQIGKVLTHGAEKYAEGSWMGVPDAERRYEDAFMRHLMSIKADKEWLDKESGIPHVFHAITNLLFLAHFWALTALKEKWQK